MSRIAAVPSSLQRSGIRKMLEKAWALEAQGRKVISLCVGEPDFPTPLHIISAAQRSLSEGQTKYIASSGLPTLRAAVAEQYAVRAPHRRHGVEHVLVSHGSMFAFSAAFMALLEPGDEVLLPDPGFPNYAQVAQLLNAAPRTYPLCARDGWLPNPADIAARITPRTKLIVICTPGNPTGAVCSLPLLQSLADISREHGVHLLSDEIYDRLVFDGSAAAPSILQTEHDLELTLVASGVAKAFSMTGFRVGWLHGPPALIGVAAKMAEVFLSCGVPFAQAAAEAALRGPQQCVAEMAKAYARRRDLALAVVAKHGLYEYSPQGAFYLLVPVPGGDADAFAHRLLEEEGVAVAPGSSFGGASSAHVRISLASSEAALAEGLGALCAMATRDRGSVVQQ